ncbi:response regulator [Cellulophaga sp. F20128]|uniref:hybrid sensor histidine kinase/response regulator transcription factor n=1 Tax=Cellulophaga sp. F20128 TaxID=2926413 RepID=UPI001FF291F6|nr:two-component regulator propeller domain-containing protein [Cellulophaga sp. F20128]MCK0157310.1 response regulator [Cellulophaga sp. F20128]
MIHQRKYSSPIKQNIIRSVVRLLSVVFLLEIVLFTLSNALVSTAQNFERFSNKEGFNQNTTYTITQDRYGFLWFGTPNGLIKYDGYEFETFTTQTKGDGNISSNFIAKLFNDDRGVLWIGTNVGIDVYIPWLEKFYTVPLSSKLEVSHICAGPNGEVWFSGQNKLYVCQLTDVDTGSFTVSENVIPENSNLTLINEFYFVEDNSLILAANSGLKSITLVDNFSSLNPQIEDFTSYDNFDGKNITTIKKVKDILWVAAEGELFKTTLEENRLYVIKKIDKIQDKVNTIFEDKNGDVWIGTTEQGLLKYIEKDDGFVTYKYNPKYALSISSNYINAIFQDNYDVLWIGTAQGGINKLDISQKQFINYAHNPYDKYAISSNLITAILEDSKGKLWVSVYDKSLFKTINRVNDKTIQKLKFNNITAKYPLLSKSVIRCIYEDKKGFIWLGTDTELVVYNPLSDRFKKINLRDQGELLLEQTYRDIYQLDDGNFLISGTQIAVIENPWEQIRTQNTPIIEVKSMLELQQERVQAVLRDRNDAFWFGTNKGLIRGRYDGEKINTSLRISDNKDEKVRLSYSNIFSLHEDNGGNIWVGTFGGGLNKIIFDDVRTPTSIEFFRKNDLLPDDAIYGILQENDSLLWASTDMGLVKFNLENNAIKVFDVRDGLAQNNFRQGAYFKGNSGYFYFGGLNGITVFKPENIKLNLMPPRVLITSLLINNKIVKIGEELHKKVILEKSISETEKISISQNEQTIAFQLVVEHTSTPTKNMFAYKLEGFNERWIESNEGKATITYTNLSAGKYIFKVKAANGDNIWNSEIKTLAVDILPPWYQTWWSYLLFFALIAFVCFGIIIYFVNHEKLKQKLNYEQLDKERIDIINQGKFRYFTNISHEFRTPLTLIAGPLEQIISTNKDTTNSKYLAIIQKNTKRLLSLVDQLITFRQAEQGFISLNLNKSTLGNFIYPTTEAFENYAIEKNINFFYKVNSPNEEIIIDVEKVERIIFNLLSNSFKNTPPHGNISIESDIVTTEKGKTIKIDVIDSGQGIPAKDLHNIFERFYQLGNKKENSSGGGIGLAFCKSLVELFDGEISAKSEPNVETRFSVLIPSKTMEGESDESINVSSKSYIKDWVPLPSEFKKIIKNKEDVTVKSKNTILIVEDEEDVQLFLSTSLSNTYNILIASNGIDGLQKIKEQEPDLVISDVMMPKMDGFAFCENIKSKPETCHIPVLLLTALGDEENLIKGLEFGADEYLSKPFSLKHLVLRVDKLIQNNIKLKEHFAKNSAIPKENIEISNRDKEFLNTIIAVIEENISDSNFGVEELSKEIGLSTSHFYRRLKQLTGQIPNVYLRNFRLQRAAELLKSNEGYNVAEVMYQIGIESNSYFSTSFKKLHGVSPSEFLKAHSAKTIS